MATDAEIRAAGSLYIPQQKYLQSPYQFNKPVVEEIEESEAPSFGIPNTNAFTNSGENNFNRSFSNNPYTAQTGYKTNRVSDYSGYLPGTRPEPSKFEPAINLFKRGLGMAIPGGNFLMGMAENNSRENRLNATDNAFIDMQLANQEQNLKGVGNLANQDAYGYGKVGFGNNYAAKVRERADIARAKAKENINNIDYEVRPIDAYYLEKEKEFKDIEDKVAQNDLMRRAAIIDKIRNAKPTGIFDPKFNIHNDAGDKTRQAAADKMQSENRQNETGGYQAGYGSDFMDGPSETIGGQNEGLGGQQGGAGGTATMGSSKDGGLIGHGGKGGRPKPGYFFGGRVNFKNGGLASIL